MKTKKPAAKKIEIAYMGWRKNVARLQPMRKVVTEAKVAATLEALRADGAQNIVTRTVEEPCA